MPPKRRYLRPDDFRAQGADSKGLSCPKCGMPIMRVLNTRLFPGSIRRRRQCQNPNCAYVWWTQER